MLTSAMDTSATAWFGLLLSISAKATMVLMLAALTALVLRRATAALRHVIWALAIVCVLCLPPASMVMPGWQIECLPGLGATPNHPRLERLLQLSPGDGATGVPSTAGSVRGTPGPGSAAGALVLGGAGPPTDRPTPRLGSQIALAIWAAGAFAVLLQVLISTSRVRRLTKKARRASDDSWQALLQDARVEADVRGPVTLLFGDAIDIPMVWGWRRPVLLLPGAADGWSRERRWLVLLHELAHVKRRDYVVQMLGHLARGMYWFNPLVWLAGRAMRREREHACDGIVLGSGCRPSSYAAHLLQIAGASQRALCAEAAAVTMARRVGLEGRVRAILEVRRGGRGASRPWTLVAVAAAIVVLAVMAAIRGADRKITAAERPSSPEGEVTVCAVVPSIQWMPAASGTRVVWVDQRNDGNDVYVYDTASGVEKAVTTDPGTQMWPEIDGDRIVWMDQRSGDWEIYLYDLSTGMERRVTSAPTSDIWHSQGPDIDGDLIVWADDRYHPSTGHHDVFLYDLRAEQLTRITDDEADQGAQGPRVHGGRIVWCDRRADANGDIYIYDVTARTECVVAEGAASQGQPDIWGDIVVWTQAGATYSDIWQCDLTRPTPRPLVVAEHNQDHPRVNGRWVVWSDDRHGSGRTASDEVYAYDLWERRQRRLLASGHAHGNLGPSIADSGLVAWQDFRNGDRDAYTNSDIYGYRLPMSSDALVATGVGEVAGARAASGLAPGYSDGTQTPRG